ncbi:MAG: 4Fe-4S dicluster domain-containing protein [Deltaproteobacteria bacterium]|nr:4Fe-4S dicluster domain-containing protein [Deltaproteobacteria bacterium]
MQDLILTDPERCTGCRICEIVCSLTKEKVINPTKSRIQVVKIEAMSLNLPVVCQQCYEAPCVSVCPAGALEQEEGTGLVRHDMDLCIGCKSCVAVCPFGAIGIDTDGHKVTKCDHCGGDPTCVRFCETGAIQYVDARTASMRLKREALHKMEDLIQRYGTFHGTQ